MNRLILIGNGFDLAHGLKADYNSFIVWYLKECLSKPFEFIGTYEYEDGLIKVSTDHPLYKFGVNSVPSISDIVDHCYNENLESLLKDDRIYFNKRSITNPFKINIKSTFFESLILNCSNSNWVDIENEFYSLLKQCFNSDGHPKIDAINQLNNTLKLIIEQLELYLSTLKCKKYNPTYSDILVSKIKVDDIVLNQRDLYAAKLYSDQKPVETLALNFNYTKTIEAYLKNRDDLPHLKTTINVNYIHGEINVSENPLIFGFGDELDDEYKKMELSKANNFFEHIKSFWYFKTSNYHNLIRFLENDQYQVYILGHSCGLSDRTLLNMIFEHTNCKSIKIFYHGDKKKNNFTHLTQEISRHFKDKVAMRSKIVPFDKSSEMPQVV